MMKKNSKKCINENNKKIKMNNSVLLEDNRDDIFNANNDILVELNKINLNDSDKDIPSDLSSKCSSESEDENSILTPSWFEKNSQIKNRNNLIEIINEKHNSDNEESDDNSNSEIILDANLKFNNCKENDSNQESNNENSDQESVNENSDQESVNENSDQESVNENSEITYDNETPKTDSENICKTSSIMDFYQTG